jgi:hypothetical protein
MKKIMCSKVIASACLMTASLFSMSVNAQNNLSMYHGKPQIDMMTRELAQDQCSAFPGKAKVVNGMIEGMGNVIVVALPNEGCGGGNNWGTSVQVFSEDGRKSEMTGFTAVEQMSIRNNRLWITSTEYGDSDPHCCPSKKGRHQFVIRGNKLVEVH